MLQPSKMFGPVLTPTQLHKLKKHQYRAENNSFLEYYIFNPFWNRIITMVPLWVAPNLITFTGFCLAVAATAVTVTSDLNAEGAVS